MSTRSERLARHIGKPCPYCDRAMDDADLAPSRDHYPVPRSHGGTRHIIACTDCNQRKGDMTAEQWQSYMAHNPRWWEKPHAQHRMPRRRVKYIQPETPSEPLRAAYASAEQQRLTRMISLGFHKATRGRRR